MTRKLDKHANDFKLYCEIIVYDQFGPLYNVAQPLCGSFKAKFCNEGCVYKHFGWLQTDYQNVFKLLRDLILVFINVCTNISFIDIVYPKRSSFTNALRFFRNCVDKKFAIKCREAVLFCTHP